MAIHINLLLTPVRPMVRQSKKYVYSIYRGNTLVKTIEGNDKIVTYTEKTPGSYKVILTVKSSLGDKTSDACVKTFTIPEPARCPQNPKLLKDDPQCQPCPGDSTIWINDSRCSASFVQTKTAVNLTQNECRRNNYGCEIWRSKLPTPFQ